MKTSMKIERSRTLMVLALVGVFMVADLAMAQDGFLKKARRGLRRARREVVRTVTRADAIATEVDSTLITVAGLVAAPADSAAEDSAGFANAIGVVSDGHDGDGVAFGDSLAVPAADESESDDE